MEFLGGYLAAAMTQTGTLATFGGDKIPTVTIFMDGFSHGIAYYNPQKGTDVELLGWDKEALQDGSASPESDFQNNSRTARTSPRPSSTRERTSSSRLPGRSGSELRRRPRPPAARST